MLFRLFGQPALAGGLDDPVRVFQGPGAYFFVHPVGLFRVGQVNLYSLHDRFRVTPAIPRIAHGESGIAHRLSCQIRRNRVKDMPVMVLGQLAVGGVTSAARRQS